ncbi:MAG: M23 family metallopeptidase [Desulfobacterales bacterium]|jgi:murein DD-endopeptidase MepM/ murein hydrolase activator NlpD
MNKSGLLQSSKIIAALLMVSVLFVASAGCVAAGNESRADIPDTVARLSSATVANGHVTVIEVDLREADPMATDLRARFDQNEIALSQHPVKPEGTFYGLVGIPISKKPQKTDVALEWTDSAGRRQSTRVVLHIIEGNYMKEALQVAPKHVKPSPKDLQRIKAEKKEIRRIYANSNQSRLWYGNFIKPLTGNTTSVFGTQRLFNGELQSYHRGTDLRAKTGTPVYASNSGIVRLAKNLFYSGNIVIVDHGKGIFTNYAHLSNIQVQAGQHVARGDQIGLSGATGRVSGPHLHWGVKINRAYVDPMQFMVVISDLLIQ